MKTRCSGTMTEAGFRAWILSALRNLTRKWKPANDAWKNASTSRSKPKSVKGRHRIEHKCADCGVWAPRKTRSNTFGIELDHIVPIGGLSCLSKLQQWVQRAFIEVEGYQKLCTDCHKIKGEKVDKLEKSIRDTYPREESSYRNMMSRCNNPNSTGYLNYGGRGIKVCDRWQESFFNFYEDMGERPENTSLDRINNEKGYCKENCRWATQMEQCRNTSTNNILIYDNKSMCIQEWAEELGIKANTLTYRILRGWPIGEALEIEPRSKSVYDGRLSGKEIIDIVNRINKGEKQNACGKLYEIDGSQVSRIYHKFKDHLYLFDQDEEKQK